MFLPRFWVHVFLPFQCLFTDRMFQKKTSKKFVKIPWLKHVIFFSKNDIFQKSDLVKFTKLRSKKSSYFTLFRTLDLKNIRTLWRKKYIFHTESRSQNAILQEFVYPQNRFGVGGRKFSTRTKRAPWQNTSKTKGKKVCARSLHGVWCAKIPFSSWLKTLPKWKMKKVGARS